MAERTVDARGQLCPKPLMMTKKALTQAAAGETLRVLIDNQTSMENVRRFLTDNGMPPAVSQEGTVYTLTVTNKAGSLARPDAAAYCAGPAGGPVVFCFKSDVMGLGDEQLGAILVKACVNTLGNLSPLPSALVFYNRGVFLALRNSPVIDSVRELAAKGVKVLACGTCLDYYKQKENLGAGVVSNMYEILETLASAGHVVYP